METQGEERVIGFIQDITSEKMKELALNKLKNSLLDAQRVSSIGSWSYDMVQDEFLVTEEVYHLFHGTKEKDIKSLEEIHQYIHPEDQDTVKKAMEEHFQGRSKTVTFRVLPLTGEMRYVRGHAEPVLNEQGKVTGIIGTLQDITESTKLEKELKKNLDLIEKTQSLAHIGSWEMDLKTREVHFSKEAYAIFGLNEDCVKNTFEEYRSYVHLEDRHLVENIIGHPMKGPIELELRIQREDGKLVHIYELVEFRFNQEGSPTHVYGMIQDISEKVALRDTVSAAEKKIHTINRRYDALIEESVDVFEILDEDGIVQYISETSERITGFSPEVKLGKSIFTFYEETEAIKLREMMREVSKEDFLKATRDIRLTSKDGGSLYVEFTMRNYLRDSAVQGIVVNFRDITKRVLYEQRILYLSDHDVLTGLPNKQRLEEEIRALLESKDLKNSFALMMLDIEDEKYIRDTLGYAVLEKYVQKIAGMLQSYCKDKVYLCRYSESRFVILVKSADDEAVYNKTVTEIQDLFSQGLLVDNYELDVDFFFGISLYRRDLPLDLSLLKQAETALYMAKTEGKGKVKYYSSDVDIQSYKQYVLRTDLKKSIINEELILNFQPIVSMREDKVLGAEALVRWVHKEWGVVSPAEFITMAEETGFIIPLGNWVLQEVCRFYRDWRMEGGKSFKISVNFSSIQLLESGFVENLLETVRSYGLEPDFLILEITENVLITEMEKIAEDLKRLRSHGILIALDDFGTGYSSLSYLASLHIDILKIDGQFTRRIHVDEASTIIIRHIIKMAQDLKLKLVAERVETFQQYSFLKELKCYTAQGYFYSPPVALPEFRRILEKEILKPVLKIGRDLLEDRRKFFRLEFHDLLETTLSIQKIAGRSVQVGNTKVLVKNIGPGGLCFISSIRFPVDQDVLFRFTAELSKEQLVAEGQVVWSSERDDDLFEYGVEFLCDENERSALVRLLGRIQILMKNDLLFSDGSFTSVSPNLYFKNT